jgi:N-formylglutamate deformylase
MHIVSGVLTTSPPSLPAAPVVFDVPRSGTCYPCDFRPDASFEDVHRSVSMYVGELYRDVGRHGATLLCALFPNTYIDANRHESDVDPELLSDPWTGSMPLAPTVKSKLGIGLIHSLVTGRKPMYARRLTSAEVQRRINTFFLPYHNELSDLIARHHDKFGVSYHVSCHSMASIGGTSTLDAGKPRSDFDIGDLNGASCDPEFSELVVNRLRSHGYKVTSNVHYAGAEAIRRHSAVSEARHSLQIEMNRALYMNEDDFTPLTKFAEIQTVLADLAMTICDYGRQKSTVRPSN